MDLVSEPMSIAAGREWDTWIQRLTRGVLELIEEGAIPAFSAQDKFIELNERLRLAVRKGADEAAKAGQATFTVHVPYTGPERRLLREMGDTLLTYLDILTVRGKIDSTMSPGVIEAFAAISPELTSRRKKDG